MAAKKKVGCLKRCRRYVKLPPGLREFLPTKKKKAKKLRGNMAWLEKFVRDYERVAQAEKEDEWKQAAAAEFGWKWPPDDPPKKKPKKAAKKPVKNVKKTKPPEPDVPEEDIDVERFKRLAKDAAKATKDKS